MNPVFGVDSARAATDQVAPGLTVLEDVVAWSGARPTVWGRYLGDGGGAATPIERAEAVLLAKNGIAPFPIFNGLSLMTETGTYAMGQADALLASNQADAAGFSPGTYIRRDFEFGWLDNLTGDYLAGWADWMRPSRWGGAGIVYANAADTRVLKAFADGEARSPANVRRIGIWLAKWTVDAPGVIFARAPAWADPAGPCYLDPALAGRTWGWQFCGGAFGDIVDLNLCLLPIPAAGLTTLPGGLTLAPGS